MTLPKILCGGPAREVESLVFQFHVEQLRAQSGFDLEVRHEIVTDPGGPSRWRGDKIQKVAKCRQDFMDAVGVPTIVVDGDNWISSLPYDALFMVDSDVILGPGVLQRMWEVDADVVYGVFWTHSDWGGTTADWPQVWDLNPYGWRQETADALLAPGINEVPVLGGGACTLFRGRAFESKYFPLLASLERHPNMFAGEDRTYCLGLECRGIKQVAVTGLPIHHCYHLSDQTRPALNAIRAKITEIGQPAHEAIKEATKPKPVEIPGYSNWP